MKEIRRLGPHLLLLLAAAAFAYVQAQPEDEASRPLEPGEIQLWSGTPKDLKNITFKGKRQIVSLESRKDDAGQWFAGTVEPVDTPAPEPAPDAGTKSSKPPKPPKPVKAATFVSVTLADKLAKKVAPMRAKRAIGEVSDERAEEFGLHDPKGTLTITIGNKTHELIIGAATQSRGHTYVRYKKDNLVYVIDSSIVRDLEGGAGRLSERQQHSWKMSEVERAAIVADADHKRDVMRSGTEGRRFWAQPATPDDNDETTANWLKKVERLRPIKALDKLPDGATRIARIDYSDKRKNIGYLELYMSKADKDEYYIVTENLRMPMTVAKPIAEQVRDDLASLFPDLAPPPKDDDNKDAGAPPAKSAASSLPAPKSPRPHGHP